MRRMAFEAIYRTNSTSRPPPEHGVFADLLRRLSIGQPNEACASDLTYIPRARSFAYLTAVIDWLTRKILSWRRSYTVTADSCLDALREVLA